VDVTDRDYFQALRGDANLESFISKPVQNRVNDTWDIYLARRLSDPNGEFMGLLVGALRVQSRRELLSSTLPADGTDVSLCAPTACCSQLRRTRRSSAQYLCSIRLPTTRIRALTPPICCPTYPLLILATRSTESALQGWRAMAAQMSAMTGVTSSSCSSPPCDRALASATSEFIRAGIEKAELEAERAKALREVEMRAAHEADWPAERTKLRKANAEAESQQRSRRSGDREASGRRRGAPAQGHGARGIRDRV